jgi:hypothetical protein
MKDTIQKAQLIPYNALMIPQDKQCNKLKAVIKEIHDDAIEWQDRDE